MDPKTGKFTAPLAGSYMFIVHVCSADYRKALLSIRLVNKKHSSTLYLLNAVGSSEILKGKQNLGVTFNFDMQDVIDFTKFSKMTMCSASEATS